MPARHVNTNRHGFTSASSSANCCYIVWRRCVNSQPMPSLPFKLSYITDLERARRLSQPSLSSLVPRPRSNFAFVFAGRRQPPSCHPALFFFYNLANANWQIGQMFTINQLSPVRSDHHPTNTTQSRPNQRGAGPWRLVESVNLACQQIESN